MKKILSLVIICSAVATLVWGATACGSSAAQDCGYTTEFVEYKKINDTLTLDMFVAMPDNIAKGETRPAIVFMHGGGWNSGSYDSFENHCRYFAEKGLVTFSINYRLRSTHKTTPYECLLDAKSAMRFIRANAAKFNVDPNKLITSGGSAGGHLAAAVNMCPKINDEQDDLSVSSASAAIVLFNPVVCNGPDTVGSYKGYGYSRVKDYYEDFSPIHNIDENVPPTIFMVGDKDHLISPEMANEYKRLIEEKGGRCDLYIYEGQKHGFYHFGRKSKNKSNFYKSTTQAHEFLVSLGYLNSAPTVDKWLDKQEQGYTYND